MYALLSFAVGLWIIGPMPLHNSNGLPVQTMRSLLMRNEPMWIILMHTDFQQRVDAFNTLTAQSSCSIVLANSTLSFSDSPWDCMAFSVLSEAHHCLVVQCFVRPSVTTYLAF